MCITQLITNHQPGHGFKIEAEIRAVENSLIIAKSDCTEVDTEEILYHMEQLRALVQDLFAPQ